jgi:hypothetical protein
MGVNFALFSENATKVELCLFDSVNAPSESQRIVIPEKDEEVWHVYLPDLTPGQLLRLPGSRPFEPQRGHRFNAHKLVLDPYAKSIGRVLRWDDAPYGYPYGTDNDTNFDERDSAPFETPAGGLALGVWFGLAWLLGSGPALSLEIGRRNATDAHPFARALAFGLLRAASFGAVGWLARDSE